MKTQYRKLADALSARYPLLAGQRENVLNAFYMLREAFASGGKLLLCGNGGSAADCDHIVGELMKSFRMPRPLPAEFSARLETLGENGMRLKNGLQTPLPAISLCTHIGISTAFANDCDEKLCYAQLVYGWGRENDVLLAISTSGNAENCVLACTAARALGIKTIALTGESGGKLKDVVDVCIAVPEQQTYAVQELHLPIYHCLCAMLEDAFFNV